MPALAHRVTIFAWVEGDTVYTQSKFSSGRKAKGAQVLVFDSDGSRLLEGKTDDNGEFSFKIPKKTALRILLKASMGHMAEWTIPAEDIAEAADINELPVSAAVSLNQQEIKKLIDESLDKKLAPIINMLVDSRDQGPKITEVIGGIGYIFGLVGVALYFANRRKKE